ncbi:MAG TPA: YqaJ viral recombinase family protein [Tenuifilaceae bacterium]|nr:YqaJ viral recombinase family protein [Tenuifilaceae bacterium]
MTDVTKNRNKFIGGSDVAAILGLNRYKTAYEVWEEKKHNIKTFEGNQATEWGKKLEPVIIAHFEQVNNVKVFDNNARYISKEYDFLGCHPDGICTINNENVLIEVKTVSTDAFKFWGNELPLEYYCQVQHNLNVLGLTKAKFIYLVLDSRYYGEIEISYDKEYAESVQKFLVKWWNEYIVGESTPIKTVTDYEKEDPDVKMVEADEDAAQKHIELIEIKAKIKELEAQKEVIEDFLKLKIGDATDLMYGLNTIATWRPQTKVTVDTKKLKEELPETFLKYATEKTSRTFLVKQPK